MYDTTDSSIIVPLWVCLFMSIFWLTFANTCIGFVFTTHWVNSTWFYDKFYLFVSKNKINEYSWDHAETHQWKTYALLTNFIYSSAKIKLKKIFVTKTISAETHQWKAHDMCFWRQFPAHHNCIFSRTCMEWPFL